MNIPLSAPDVGEREVEYVNRVLRSSQLSMGPWLEKFENEFARFIGTKHAIAVNSGTSGLHLCVRALGIGANDEVITTSFSFVASVSCFLYEGALPALVDIDPKTLNLDPAAVRDFLRSECTRSPEGSVIDRRSGRIVKAIMPVHIFGLPCQMDALMEIAREYGLQVIEDACEAIGAEFHGQRTGTFGNAAVFAFYPNKQMTTGEGGMITTNDSRIAELCRSMRNQGRDTDGAWLRHVRIGYNYRLSELHAALGLAQLERIDEILASRAEIASRYSELLASHPQLQLLGDDPRVKRSWFVYIIRLRSGSPAFLRDRLRASLREQGIATQIYFTPIHLQPFYQKCQSGTVRSLPQTEQAADECLALPFHTRLSEMEIKFVCDAVNQALEPQKQPTATASRNSAPLVSTQVAET
jgi:dTDP-4-amino-4,6-dideoxygalactose transaminase